VRRRATVVAAAVMAGVLVTLSSGCAQLDSGDQIGGIQDAAAQRALADGMAAAFRPSLTVNPPDGTSGVSPTEPVTAAAAGGQLTKADLKTVGGAPLPGVLSPDGARWSSTAPLKPNTSYVLHTVVRSSSGQETPADTKFSTLAPGQQVTGAITPKTGEQANPATPISVVFSRPIADHAAVERSLVVTSTPPLTGSTHWRGDRELVWQSDGLWQAGSKVTATLDFFGKQVGPGVFGGGDLRTAFHVGSLDQVTPDESTDPDADPGADPDLPPDATDPSLAAPADPGAGIPPNAAAAAPGNGRTVAAPNGAPRAIAPGTTSSGTTSSGARPPGATSSGARTPGATSPGATSPGTSGSSSGSTGSGASRSNSARSDSARSGSSDRSDDSDSDDGSDTRDDRDKPNGPSLPVLH
jgi:hypothetical protein